MMKKKFVIFPLIVCMFITCTKMKGPLPMSIPTAADCDSTWYTGGRIESIIKTNCAVNGSTCHGAGSAYDYTTYAGVKNDVDNGKFKFRVLDLKNMPKTPISPLSILQLKQIDCWLTKSAPETE